jgi:hypothetical protein
MSQTGTLPAFEASATFTGPRHGDIFTTRELGSGYYWDAPSAHAVASESGITIVFLSSSFLSSLVGMDDATVSNSFSSV